MRVLVACEYSGRVREAFRRLGHDAWSCDLLPAEDGSTRHLQEDVLKVMRQKPMWDLVIAHPPCTDLCVSGARWWKEKSPEQMRASADFFLAFTKLRCKWAIENPIGRMSSEYRKPDQIIQPWHFGHNASKATCLWLRGLPKLGPTKIVFGRNVNGRMRWENQTDSGQNKLPPSAERWKERSRTYQGIADAMAAQWSEC